MIDVIVAEDQQLVRGAIAALLELEGDIRVVAQARDGDEALALIAQHRPNVLVTDIEMPNRDGLALAADVRATYPGTRTIIVTTFARPGYLRRAMDAGVAGYLLKDRPATELAAAVRSVHGGGVVVDPALAVDALRERDPLTEREREVLRLAGDGKSAPSIAQLLHLSEGTVRNYLSEAIGKLGAGNRIEAARLAREKGFL